MKPIVVCPVERVVIQLKREALTCCLLVNDTHVWRFGFECDAEALAINLEAALLRPAKWKRKR